MFEQNFGSQTSRWLKWFMVAMVIYAVSTLWPEHQTITFIGLGCSAIGITMARNQISKGRRD